MFSLEHLCYDLDLPVDIRLELFDQMVVPILLYGSEVWGFEEATVIESLHSRFCKKLLRVHKYTPNCIALCELGRVKLTAKINTRILNYWLKIASDPAAKISTAMYRLSRAQYDTGTHLSPWLNKVHGTLNSLGLGYLWHMNPIYINKNWFKHITKLRLLDTNHQDLSSSIESNGQCVTYNAIKSTGVLAPYLSLLDSQKRLPITKIRCLNNRLPIVTGRHHSIDRNERFCPLCMQTGTQVIGDECHYILECPSLVSSRRTWLDRTYHTRPSMSKFVALFNSDDKNTLEKLSHLCSDVLKLMDNK